MIQRTSKDKVVNAKFPVYQETVGAQALFLTVFAALADKGYTPHALSENLHQGYDCLDGTQETR